MKAIDLFCGCGGASLGLKLAGHKVIAAVDNDPVACKTFSENLDFEPFCYDLRYFNGDHILEMCELRKGDIDLVVGCPPCQGFSSLRRTRYPSGEDIRKGLVTVFLERISEIQPRAVIFENVPGIVSKEELSYLQMYLLKMEKMGYKTSWKLVNAADYGVPQFRRRVIALSVKDGIRAPIFPLKTHSKPEEAEDDLKPWRTVRDAIGDLPPLVPGESCTSIPNHTARNHSSRVLEIVKKVPKNGGSRRSLPLGLWLPCHLKLSEEKGRGAESVYGRMSWDKPSPTITCRCTTPSSGRFIHPEQDRAITPREAARLQSFPDNFVFPEKFKWAERLIGNAMPPTLMVTLMESFEETL
ncbi:MAG: DNA cytosine methyltransferase [Candidatus Jordarchaeales archaeon]